MNIRPKTIRRLVALLLVCVLLAAAGVVVWFYHQQNKTRQLQADREFGIAAFHAGDYPLALERLRAYKEKFPDDYDAVYAYAAARLRVPSPAGSPGRNISEAKQLFEQLNRARPDDANVSHVLLDLYTSFNFYPEAVRLADAVLASDPRDTAALYAKAFALQGAGKPDDALAAVEKLNAIDPGNFRSQRL